MHRRSQAPGAGRAFVRMALAFASFICAAHAADPVVPVDGPPLAVTAEKSGQPLRVTFRAEAGQHLGLGMTALKFVPESAGGVAFTVRQPDGTPLPGMEFLYCAPRAGGACDGQFAIAKSGVHTIEVDTPFSAAARFSIQLSKIETRDLIVDKPQAATLSRVGQEARFALKVAAGQNVSVELRDVAPDSKDARFVLRLVRPDGSTVGEARADARTPASLSLGASAPAGAYVVEVDPDDGATGSFVALAKVAATMADGSIEVASGVNEVLRFNFTAAAGEGVSVALDNLTHTPADMQAFSRLAIVKSDGTRIAGMGCGGRARFCKTSAEKLEAGDYAIHVTPPQGGSVSGRLYRTKDVVGSLNPSSTTRVELQPAQVGRYEVRIAAGESIGFRVARTSPENKALIGVTLLSPEIPKGAAILNSYDAATQIVPKEYPSGTYMLRLNNQSADKTSLDITVIH
jgi:hypothetical protein